MGILIDELRNHGIFDCKKNERNIVTAYVDGSYNINTNTYGFGVVLIADNRVFEYRGRGNNKDMVNLRNVAGELLGAMYAIEWSLANGFNGIIVNYDYYGIEKWAKDEWKANLNITKEYKEYFKNRATMIDIEFKKIRAHSGHVLNNKADKLAREAVSTQD